MFGRTPYKKLRTALTRAGLRKHDTFAPYGGIGGQYVKYSNSKTGFYAMEQKDIEIRLFLQEVVREHEIARFHSAGYIQVSRPDLLQRMFQECKIKFDIREFERASQANHQRR